MPPKKAGKQPPAGKAGKGVKKAAKKMSMANLAALPAAKPPDVSFDPETTTSKGAASLFLHLSSIFITINFVLRTFFFFFFFFLCTKGPGLLYEAFNAAKAAKDAAVKVLYEEDLPILPPSMQVT